MNSPNDTWQPQRHGKVLEPLYRCPECLDRGWIDDTDTDSGLPPIMHPCRHCRQVAYRRWSEGHYRLDHHCEECSAVRSGQVASHDYDRDGNWVGSQNR